MLRYRTIEARIQKRNTRYFIAPPPSLSNSGDFSFNSIPPSDARKTTHHAQLCAHKISEWLTRFEEDRGKPTTNKDCRLETDDWRLRTKRPPRQKGGLFFQGRIVLTEGKVRQNFLAKSYGPKKGGVKEILDNKCLCFQSLTKASNNR